MADPGTNPILSEPDAGLRTEPHGIVTVESPLGRLALVGHAGAVTNLRFGAVGTARVGACALLETAAEQLAAYFAGERRAFDLPLRPAGTPFQLRVWTALAAVPFGTTTTYAELAAAVGDPRAARAVGRALAANPLPILVPCHRVVGAAGELTGYGGGFWRKEWLLRHEGATLM